MSFINTAPCPTCKIENDEALEGGRGSVNVSQPLNLDWSYDESSQTGAPVTEGVWEKGPDSPHTIQGGSNNRVSSFSELSGGAANARVELASGSGGTNHTHRDSSSEEYTENSGGAINIRDPSRAKPAFGSGGAPNVRENLSSNKDFPRTRAVMTPEEREDTENPDGASNVRPSEPASSSEGDIYIREVPSTKAEQDSTKDKTIPRTRAVMTWELDIHPPNSGGAINFREPFKVESKQESNSKGTANVHPTPSPKAEQPPIKSPGKGFESVNDVCYITYKTKQNSLKSWENSSPNSTNKVSRNQQEDNRSIKSSQNVR